MSAVVIQFGQLESAARNMRYAASDMESYADALPRKIQNPISSLTGGSSGDTSAVAQLAAQKARQLRARAAAYKALASKTEAFADEARGIDAQVGRRIGAVADSREQNLSLWDRFKYNMYKAINGTIGSTVIGAFIGSLIDRDDARKKKRASVIRDILNWFKRGDGKYVLNIGISFLGAIGAVCGAILAFPVSGFLATLIAVCAVVGAAITVAQTLATIWDNCHALGKNGTEPGIARYYGSTSSLKDWVKKNKTDRNLQNLAGTVDFIGAAAGAISTVGSLGVRTAADGVTKVTSLDGPTVKQNLLKEIGIKPGQYGGQFNDWKFSPGTIFGLGKKPTEGLTGIQHVADVIKTYTSPVEKMGKTFDTLLNYDIKFSFSDLKTGAKVLGDVLPGVSGPKHIVSVTGFAANTTSGSYWK